jgi:hypothetical protein
MTSIYTLTGHEAIRIAERDGITLRKYADPTEGAREVNLDEGRDIAREDPSLIHAEVTALGWTEGDGSGHDGYAVDWYFDRSGCYLGTDEFGIEPKWNDAPTEEEAS